MRSEQRVQAQRQLDKKLLPLRDNSALIRPSNGWIRAIRRALGMTSGQLGARMGLSQSRALRIEQGEVAGTLSIDTLERAAQALDCRLVYAFVPNDSLQGLVESRATMLAAKRLNIIGHSMSLEDQALNEEAMQLALETMTKELREKSNKELWADHDG